MTVRPILTIGNPELRIVAEAVDPNDITSPATQQLIDDLIDTMRDANGAGLAATQVGAHVRIAVMEVGDNPRYPYKPRMPLTVAINPIIEPIDDELVEVNEGCLSVPDLRGAVPRPARIRYRGIGQDGVAIEREVAGFHARVVQHECDHLDGILYPMRMSDLTSLHYVSEIRHNPLLRGPAAKPPEESDVA